MSQSNIEVPTAPAAPATPPPAAPPAATAPVTPPAAAPVAAPVVAPPAAVTPSPATTQDPPQEEPPWFKPRIEQATRSGANSVLKKLGVKDEAEAEALIKKAKADEEAAKTELQKAKERGDSLAAQAARAGDLEKVVTARADVEMATLTETQKTAVIAIAGDDPAKRLSTIDTLKATWASNVPAPTASPPAAAVATTPAPVTPPVAPPATTSPPPNAPAGTTVSPVDHAAEYKALKAKNPHQAALYLNAYADKIYPRA